ncbi:MAG: hypothetical protein PHP74_03675 [Candidatus Gracilibacteria bacterium]|nr:hypothetical protein [Candidatus Gracilibacteria bacterium]
MTEDVKPYYQTTVSKTIFYPEDADPDDYGLEDYRKDEVRAVRDFVRSESNLLIIGGVSASGKTHLSHRIRESDSFDYYDLQQLKKHSPLREPGCSDISGCVNDMVANVYNRPDWMTEPKGIILDEGLVLANKETDDNLRALIDELLRRYSKVIISGGGAQYTGVEQSEIIAGCMPADARIEKLIMTIKTFNSVQGAEFLMERSKELGMGMSPEVAKAIAESMVPYFNMPRVLYRLACYPDKSGKYKIYSESVITSGIMPKEVYKPMWQKQVGIWKERGLMGSR